MCCSDKFKKLKGADPTQGGHKALTELVLNAQSKSTSIDSKNTSKLAMYLTPYRPMLKLKREIEK